MAERANAGALAEAMQGRAVATMTLTLLLAR